MIYKSEYDLGVLIELERCINPNILLAERESISEYIHS